MKFSLQLTGLPFQPRLTGEGISGRVDLSSIFFLVLANLFTLYLAVTENWSMATILSVY